MQSDRGGRNEVFDWLRTVAILIVLVVHAVPGYEQTNLEKFTVDWLTTVFRPCIAIFLFSAGFFFPLDADFKYLVRRIKRVGIPYLVFSFLALLYQTRGIGFIPEVLNHPGKVLGNLLIGNTWGVYWFIPMILANYIFAYLVLRFKRQSLVQITFILMVVNLLHAAYYYRIISHFQITEHPLIWLYSYRFFISWPFFFFLGIVFREYQLMHYLAENKALVISIWLLILGLNTFLLYNGIIQAGGYNSVIDTLASVSAIGMLLVTAARHRWITFIGETSYTIYLSHYFFYSFIRRVASMAFGEPPFWFTWVGLVFILAGPLILIWIARQALGKHSRLWLGA